MLNRTLKISTLVGPLLIFCGVLKLVFFYNSFNINILEFINFTEIITSFLDDLNIILLFGLIMMIQSLPILNYTQRKSKLAVEDFYSVLLQLIYPRRFRYAIFFLIVGLSLGILLVLGIFEYNYPLIYIIVFCFIQFLFYSTMYLDEEGNVDESDSSIALNIILTIILSIVLLAKHDAQVVNSQQHETTLKIDGKNIECSKESELIYLGKTESFVFLYDKQKDQSRIVQAEHVDEYFFNK
jgi:hypothetical protein